MKRYYVEAPLTGKACGYVMAESQDEAISKVLGTGFRVEVSDIDIESDVDSLELEELELHTQVNRGNVCYGPLSEAFAEIEEG